MSLSSANGASHESAPDDTDSKAPSDPHFENRILVLAPTGRDGSLIATVLAQTGNTCEVCIDAEMLCRRFLEGAGTVLVAEEALAVPDMGRFQKCLAEQEPWSDLPLLVLTSGGFSSRISKDTLKLLETSCNVTLLERPLRRETLNSAVHAALRARSRQYETRDLLHQLKSSVRQRDEFLAMLGHELRNPLFTIRTAIELLKQSDTQEPLAVQTRTIVERQTQHLSHLIDDLLDVARITQGKIPLQLQPLDLNEVAQSCMEAIELAGASKKHRLALCLSATPVIIKGDAVRLEQILNNLLTNAVKYTPAGGEIQMSVEATDSEAIVRVCDNGLGIDPELQPHIFDLFTQATRSLDRSQGGLGIGLTVTHGLVQMHCGRISVSSEGLGQGSQFEVGFPLESTVPLAVPKKPANAVLPSGHRILLVEDNVDASAMMQILLQRRGYQVEVAGDGLEGVARAVAAHPDIALVDIGLPKIDGYEVARRVRAQLGSGLYMIALTGYGQAEDQARALEAGFNRHLTKPVEPEELFRVLAEAIPAKI